MKQIQSAITSIEITCKPEHIGIGLAKDKEVVAVMPRTSVTATCKTSCSLPTCSATEQPLVYSDEGRNFNDEKI
jgi:hypothetical protein